MGMCKGFILGTNTSDYLRATTLQKLENVLIFRTKYLTIRCMLHQNPSIVCVSFYNTGRNFMHGHFTLESVIQPMKALTTLTYLLN